MKHVPHAGHDGGAQRQSSSSGERFSILQPLSQPCGVLLTGNQSTSQAKQEDVHSSKFTQKDEKKPFIYGLPHNGASVEIMVPTATHQGNERQQSESAESLSFLCDDTIERLCGGQQNVELPDKTLQTSSPGWDDAIFNNHFSIQIDPDFGRKNIIDSVPALNITPKVSRPLPAPLPNLPLPSLPLPSLPSPSLPLLSPPLVSPPPVSPPPERDLPPIPTEADRGKVRRPVVKRKKNQDSTVSARQLSLHLDELKATSSGISPDPSLVRRFLMEGDIDFVEKGKSHVDAVDYRGAAQHDNIRRKVESKFLDVCGAATKRRGSSLSRHFSRRSREDFLDFGGSYKLRHTPSEVDRKSREEEEMSNRWQKDLTIQSLSKAEGAHVTFDIWTESRRGQWTVKCPADEQGIPADNLPQIADVWSLPIDSKGVVRRNKMKSNIELSSTRTIVRCPHCSVQRERGGGLYYFCQSCQNSERVEMVYTVQCTIRLAHFLPLHLPARLLFGAKQPHIRYVESAELSQSREILHDRALDGLQSAASRVMMAHHTQHGSRLLMGRATVTRRGVLTIGVTSRKTGTSRYFDVEDGDGGEVWEVTAFIQREERKRTMPRPSMYSQGFHSTPSLPSMLSGQSIPIPTDSTNGKARAEGEEKGAFAKLNSSRWRSSGQRPSLTLSKKAWKSFFAR